MSADTHDPVDRDLEPDRTFHPAARYAANRHPQVRWHDPRTGQEHFARPIGAETFSERAESLESALNMQIPDRCSIEPYQDDRWIAELQFATLDCRREQGHIQWIGLTTISRTQVLDERDNAVAWLERRFAAFADADRCDAAAWFHRQREACQ